MSLNWAEMNTRALAFSKVWADACNEKSQSIPFWIDFFDIFGIPNKRVADGELHPFAKQAMAFVHLGTMT